MNFLVEATCWAIPAALLLRHFADLVTTEAARHNH